MRTLTLALPRQLFFLYIFRKRIVGLFQITHCPLHMGAGRINVMPVGRGVASVWLGNSSVHYRTNAEH
jgi:hypothetical protein